MEPIEIQIKKVVDEMKNKEQGNTSLESFQLAIIMFDELVKKGLVKNRGYNLSTSDQQQSAYAFLKTK